MSRDLGTSRKPGYISAVPPTDPGLGPSSKPADSSEKPEESGTHQVRQADTADVLLEGFGAQRPDRGRILPQKESTPIPEQVKPGRPAGGSTTHPAMRKIHRRRQTAFFLIIAACVLGAIFVAWKVASPSTPEPDPVAATTTANIPPPPTTTVTNAVPTIQPIPVENLAPSPTDTAPTAVTARPTAKPTAKPTTSATTTAPAAITAPTSTGPDPLNDVKRTM